MPRYKLLIYILLSFLIGVIFTLNILVPPEYSIPATVDRIEGCYAVVEIPAFNGVTFIDLPWSATGHIKEGDKLELLVRK